MDVYMQELDKARSLNEKLGLGIGLFQVFIVAKICIQKS